MSDRLDAFRDLGEGRILGIELSIEAEPVTRSLGIPEREVRVDQAAIGDHLRRVATDHPLEHIDRRARIPGLQLTAPERDSSRAGTRVVTEPFFEDRDRLVCLPVAAVLLGKLEKQPR